MAIQEATLYKRIPAIAYLLLIPAGDDTHKLAEKWNKDREAEPKQEN